MERTGTIHYNSPDPSGRFYASDTFLRKAGEVMGLTQASGSKVAKILISELASMLPPNQRRKFTEAFPDGLRQEIEDFHTHKPKEPNNQEHLLNRVRGVTLDENPDPRVLIPKFWSLLRDYFSEKNEGEDTLEEIFRTLPHEMKSLLANEQEEKWSRDLL